MISLAEVKSSVAANASDILGTAVEPEWVELANPKAGSHLALPCFRMRIEGLNPAEISTKVAKNLEFEGIDRAEAAGPYVNIWLNGSFLAEAIDSAASSDVEDAESNGQTVIVEFLSSNLAKPLSIGHMRNVLQGRALALLYKNAGYNVVTDNHIGDWGTVFGMWVIGFERYSSEVKLAEGGVKEMGRMYIEVRKALKEEEASGKTDLRESIQQWLKKLEAQDAEALAYHQKFTQITLLDIAEKMQSLGVIFDYNYGESFYIKRGKEMVEELVNSGGAVRQEDGSVIIDLTDQGIDTPMLIEKSNGAALYSTSDIATIDYREKTWQPEKVMYVVGSEQKFYFKQLFAANKKLKWSDAELIHHDYGLIEELDGEGKRRKMSSRENAVYLSDLLDIAHEKAREIAPDDLSDQDVEKISQAAITFREFSASHSGNTLFDWESMFSLSGFSGPYVQYAAVRVNALLAKSETDSFEKPSQYDYSQYADILWLLARFNSVVAEATEQREGHKLAEYAYELARQWNRFYENNPVLDSDEPDKSARLWLVHVLGLYLARSLELIGISVPSKM